MGGRLMFRIGEWRVRPDRNEITGPGGPVRLEPKVMSLLCLLAEQAPATVSRDAIVERLWSGRAVTDEAITKQISKLRAALGDDAREPRLLATVQKVGVRLLAPVITEERRSLVRRRWAMGSAGLAAAVLAVSAWLLLRPHGIDASQVRIRPLTTDAGSEVDPALSPDGAWLAYAARPPGESRFGLFVRLMAEDQPRRMGPADADLRAPAWSADGRLAFVAHQGGGCAIMIGSPLGRTQRLAGCVAAETGGLAWDGTEALIVADRPGLGQAFRLDLISVRSGARRPLTGPPAGSLGDFHPLVRGRRIYFIRSLTVGPAEIFALDPRSGRTRQLSRDNARITGLAPGPGAGLLVASEREDGVGAIWSLDANGRRWRKLASTAAGALTASADGQRAVFPVLTQRATLWSEPIAGGAGASLAPSSAMDWSPVTSPDGRTLAYLSNRSGAWNLWVARADGAGARQLSRFDGPAIQDPTWSPDGRSIAVAVPSGGQFDIALVDLATGRGRALVHGPLDDRYPAFSPDGRWLYFSRRRGSRYELVRREIAGGGERLVESQALRALPSPDGRSLYFGRPFQPGLWRITPGLGPAVRVSGWPDWVGARNWTLAGDEVWGLERQAGGRARLMRLSTRTGRQTALRTVEGLSRRSGLAVIGDRIVYARAGAQDADLFSLSIGGGQGGRR